MRRSFFEVNDSYVEADMNAMPKSPTLEDGKEVILRKMSCAVDEAFFRGDHHAGGVNHAIIAAHKSIIGHNMIE